MLQQGWVRLYRAFFGMLALVTVGVHFVANNQRDLWTPVNFFSLFTIQSNLIAAIVLLVGAVAAREHALLLWSLVRGAAVMYMVTTGVVHTLILSGLEQSTLTTPLWVNIVLHQLLPLVMVVDLMVRPITGHHLTMRQALGWLLYPLLYLGYTLVRGARTDWYPYPFLDPNVPGGYGTVAFYCTVVLLGFLAISSLIVVLMHRSAADALSTPTPV
jgi:hypothetical protein